MPATPSPSSLLAALLGASLGPLGRDAGNRVSFEGLTLVPGEGGALQVGVREVLASSLRLASGPFVLEVGQLSLQQVAGVVRVEGGRPRLQQLEAASGALSGVKLYGPLALSQQAGAPATGTWSLAPLAAANGTIRAEIVDAHLLFDADVTVPVRQGQIEFKEATVEHVGPDSRMGVSRLGLYVDAPNGRSYLYQFPSTPIAGVEFEKRGAMLGPWVTDRGRMQLQPFGEWLLGQHPAGQALTFTEQARQLFDRTAVSGELRLGDGRIAVPGLSAELTGRGGGSNVVRVHSQSVGRGITGEVRALSVGGVVVKLGQTELRCEAVEGAVVVQVSAERGELRFAVDIGTLKLTRLRVG